MKRSLSQAEIEEWIRDPVMAAWGLFGIDLDVFQAARLRYMWFSRWMFDSSGVSTGKSEIMFIWACLRAILLPNPPKLPPQIICVYYTSLGTAKEVFWPKFDKYIENSPLFREQLFIHRRKWGDVSSEGVLKRRMKNGSLIELPAADFARDSKNQASRRFNHLCADEICEIDSTSSGVDKQLISRATAPCFNKNHPLHGNKILLFGHAEDPMTHPAYKRVKQARRFITDGSQKHVLFTSSFRDLTKKFEKYREDDVIREEKRTLTDDEFMQKWEGIWKIGGLRFYDSKWIQNCRSINIMPQTRRESADDIHVLGWDTAPGSSQKSDFSGGVTWRARPVPESKVKSVDGLMEFGGEYFTVAPVHALVLHGRGGPECSGVVHKLDDRFSYAKIMMDPGGGGAWIYKEMVKSEQLIDGQRVERHGLCEMADQAVYPTARPIVASFKRGNPEIREVFDRRWMTSDEGIIEAGHREMMRALSTSRLMLPAEFGEHPVAVRRNMSDAEIQVLETLERFLKELSGISVVTKDKKPVITSKGFMKFHSKKGKKDIAMAGMYGFTALLAVLREMTGFEMGKREGEDCIGMV